MELECEEVVEGNRFFRLTFDLSAFGVSTRFGPARERGTRVDLALWLPDDPQNPVKVKAEVVGTAPMHQGARLAFRNPPAEAVRRIHRYLKSRGLRFDA